jgi:hypothetical protein
MAQHVWILDYNRSDAGGWRHVFASRAGAVAHLAKLITEDIPAGLLDAGLASDQRVLDELAGAGVAMCDPDETIGGAEIVSGVCDDRTICADLFIEEGLDADTTVSFGITRQEVRA